jgi:hypothetical protein
VARQFDNLGERLAMYRRLQPPSLPNAQVGDIGLPDWWETEHDPGPDDADTDDDGLSEGEEVNTYNTAPADADSDGDGLADGVGLTCRLVPT